MSLSSTDVSFPCVVFSYKNKDKILVVYSKNDIYIHFSTSVGFHYDEKEELQKDLRF